ncbi:MAG: HEAT repeat domain-containing protein [Fuerstiella sp.]|nr:HEAT repeat domain-containing protein [Fuerstiella sp.]
MRLLSLLISIILATTSNASEFKLNGQSFMLPDGFEIEDIAGGELVERPVSADFDEQGRLYVTDSSGSNEHVDIQRKKRPHRIVRLTDNNGDGRFDSGTVYADQLMFPEGSMWFDGSLYVAAPPEIWKFTDTDDDGVAENREIWFDGKTLTHCANDLHGPYLGPDGWIYWCKGAFARQTYQRTGRPAFQTKAAHIFRRRPEGGPIESVMTGGMDNPVEVAFTPGGERLFTTTFLIHPRQGLRDGVIHAIYGGVYGKDHSAIDGHPRTGDLMPVLSHLGVAAPCGLARLESDGLGKEFQNNVLTCSFNMHKVVRHVLTKNGATFHATDSILLQSNDLDFHPTDVVEDADGSVIVVDTGGWFRLCCPTSQLEKPDVLGGIYRIRRSQVRPVEDPRGQQLDWNHSDDATLAEWLGDTRFSVRLRARQIIGRRGVRMIPALRRIVESSNDPHHRLQAVWALTWINGLKARQTVRTALTDADETVRQAAIHSVSVHRDHKSHTHLRAILTHGTPHNRRAAAEALGRVGSAADIPALLSAVPAAMLPRRTGKQVVDRCLEHSLIYATMELNAPEVVQQFLTATNDRTRRAALIALDQMNGDHHLGVHDIRELLVTKNQILNGTAWWIAAQHSEWGDHVADAFLQELRSSDPNKVWLERFGERLTLFAESISVQQLMGDMLLDTKSSPELCVTVLDAMTATRLRPIPDVWEEAINLRLNDNKRITRAALGTLKSLGNGQFAAATVSRLQKLALQTEGQDADIRLRAIRLLPTETRELTPEVFEFVCSELNFANDVTNRSVAVDILNSTPLTSDQLQHLAHQLPQTGVMELGPLMDAFTKSTDPQVGTALVTSLRQSPAATSLFPDRLTQIVNNFGDGVVNEAAPLLKRIEVENGSKVERVESILALLPKANIRRGLKVFQSAAASCLACHRRAYLGGEIGPDLNRIGQVRSERDLLESILFPSLTFVRNYEPISIVTTSGLIHNGILHSETDDVVILQLDANKTVEIPKAEIDERHSGTTSIMPAGLEKQLSPQDLADLVRYLKEG